MNKIQDFYRQVKTDEKLVSEVEEILGGKRVDKASDEQLLQMGNIAAKLGYDITLEEIKAYLNANEEALDDDELDIVAGGKGDESIVELYKGDELSYQWQNGQIVYKKGEN